jgi:hypothetical protein
MRMCERGGGISIFISSTFIIWVITLSSFSSLPFSPKCESRKRLIVRDIDINITVYTIKEQLCQSVLLLADS